MIGELKAQIIESQAQPPTPGDGRTHWYSLDAPARLLFEQVIQHLRSFVPRGHEFIGAEWWFRAGRAAKPGEVLIQTRHPEAAVIAALAAGDRDAFYAAETEARRDAGAPPFGRWAAVIVSSEDDAEARDAARAIGGAAPRLADVAILGPAPAPMALLRGRHRYRLLINARRSAEVQRIIRDWLGPLRFPPGVRVAVDIDPYSFV